MFPPPIPPENRDRKRNEINDLNNEAVSNFISMLGYSGIGAVMIGGAVELGKQEVGHGVCLAIGGAAVSLLGAIKWQQANQPGNEQ